MNLIKKINNLAYKNERKLFKIAVAIAIIFAIPSFFNLIFTLVLFALALFSLYMIYVINHHTEE